MYEENNGRKSRDRGVIFEQKKGCGFVCRMGNLQIDFERGIQVDSQLKQAENDTNTKTHTYEYLVIAHSKRTQ